MALAAYSIFIIDGQLNAAENTLKNDPVFNDQGVLAGQLSDFISVDLQRVGGGGSGWKGTLWFMEPTGTGIISFEEFQSRVIEELNMQHNTGDASTQIASYVEDEFGDPPPHPRIQFEQALVDTVKKPDALERVEIPLSRTTAEARPGIFRRVFAALKWFFIEDLDWND